MSLVERKNLCMIHNLGVDKSIDGGILSSRQPQLVDSSP